MIQHYTDSLFSDLDTTILKEAYKSPYLGHCDVLKAKEFYKALKDNILDLDAFHSAFDDDIQAAGLMDIFNDAGFLVHRGTYGKMKEYSDQKASFIIALKKLWVAQYVDNLKTIKEKEEAAAGEAELAKKREEERLAGEAERKAKEEQEKLRQQKVEAFAKKIIPLLDEDLYSDLVDNVPDPIMAQPKLSYRPDETWVTFTGSKDSNNNTHSYKYVYGKRKVDILDITDEDLKAFADTLNKLIPKLIDELDQQATEKSILDNPAIKALRASSYIFKDESEYIKISIDDSHVTTCHNLTTGSNTVERLTNAAKLYGIIVYANGSSGRCWYNNSYSVSWNNAIPKKIIDELGWYEYEKGNYICGSSFKLVEAPTGSTFCKDFDFNSWGVWRTWCDSSD